MPSLIAFSFACLAASGLAQEQEGPFSNASLQGTYVFSLAVAGDGSPIWDMSVAGMSYIDGQGNARLVFFVANFPGEPDADGNPTRNIVRNLSDASTWNFGTGTYEVFPFGAAVFMLGDAPNDLVPTGTGVIDDVLTITEFTLYNRSPAATGGVGLWKGVRIADGDLLPPAPEE